MSESVGPLGSLIPGAVLIMYPTLHGFCSTSVSEPNNFLDQLLGDSGAPEVLMVNVSGYGGRFRWLTCSIAMFISGAS